MDAKFFNPHYLFRKLLGAFSGLGGAYDVEERVHTEFELTSRLPLMDTDEALFATTIGAIKNKFEGRVSAPVPVPSPNPEPPPETPSPLLIAYFDFSVIADDPIPSCAGTFTLGYRDSHDERRQVLKFTAGQTGYDQPFLIIHSNTTDPSGENKFSRVAVTGNEDESRCEIRFYYTGVPLYDISVAEGGWTLNNVSVEVDPEPVGEVSVSLSTDDIVEGASYIHDSREVRRTSALTEHSNSIYLTQFSETAAYANGAVITKMFVPMDMTIVDVQMASTSRFPDPGPSGVDFNSIDPLTGTPTALGSLLGEPDGIAGEEFTTPIPVSGGTILEVVADNLGSLNNFYLTVQLAPTLT